MQEGGPGNEPVKGNGAIPCLLDLGAMWCAGGSERDGAVGAKTRPPYGYRGSQKGFLRASLRCALGFQWEEAALRRACCTSCAGR